MTEKLLETAGRIVAEQASFQRDKIPGGSVSFLFERSSKMTLQDEKVVDEDD